MALWPRSLFGRLAVLLLVVVAVTLASTILLFRQDRIALLTRQFGETKVAQIQALRAALEAPDAHEHRETLGRIGRQYDARIFPESERGRMGVPVGPALQDVADHLAEALGPGTELRIQPRQRMLWVRIAAGGDVYWAGFALPPRAITEESLPRAAIASIALAVALLFAAFLFARYLSAPLRVLSAAAERVGRGEMPPALPESGPFEISNLNRGFNRMTANLKQLENDRALMLAGVSHDLRTPLARLRLGVEMGDQDPATQDGMVSDIEEIDRIIGQFLDFARDERGVPSEARDPNPIVAACVERAARLGHTVLFTPGVVPPIPLRAAAFARLVNNLIDNACAYGSPPVEATTSLAGDFVVLEIADRGPGIPADQIERLKQPFTRASAARTNVGGIAGAGLGLAIVDRIARWHDGSFDLAEREGGGTIARISLPIAPSSATAV